MSHQSRIWLTWETQPRNKELAQAFGCKYSSFDHSNHPRLIRYSLCILHTLRTLLSNKHTIVFAQCPSLVLSLLTVMLKPIRKYRLVIDAHNAAIEYTQSKSSIVAALARFCLRSADFVIVTNNALAKDIKQLGAKPLVLVDKLPSIEIRLLPNRFAQLKRPLVTLIATFAPDEPIEEFLKAATETDEFFTLLVTGNRHNANKLLQFESKRIIFSDFLYKEDYEGTIRNSDLLVDLTTRENCLVCGAYEALSVGTPCLLSATSALRETFPQGFIFANNNTADYIRALQIFFAHSELYQKGISTGLQNFNEKWNKQFLQVYKQLGLISKDSCQLANKPVKQR